ncbi:MAG: hypothetical protein H6679_01480 [Epsilonproteobacteria bacterium]|nr:hypothetical protein [Campylobacterota bacterium]
MKNRNQFLTLTLTAVLSFNAGQAMDEKLLAEKEQREMTQQNPTPRFQPESLKDICWKVIIENAGEWDYQDLKMFEDAQKNNPDFLKKAIVSKFYPELTKAFRANLETTDATITCQAGHSIICCRLSNDGKSLAVVSRNCAQPWKSSTGNDGYGYPTEHDNIAVQIWRYENDTWKHDITLLPELPYGAKFLNAQFTQPHGKLFITLATQGGERIAFKRLKNGSSWCCENPNWQDKEVFHLPVRLTIANDAEHNQTHIFNGRRNAVATINTQDTIHTADLSQDCKHLVTTSNNNFAQLWSLKDGSWHNAATIKNESTIKDALFFNHNKGTVLIFTDNSVQIVPISPNFEKLSLQELLDLLKAERPLSEKIEEAISNVDNSLANMSITDNKPRG